jgi:hypothetical protein
MWQHRCQVSEAIGFVAVWDDILLKRDAERSIGNIRSAMSEYFSIEHERDGCHISVHVGDVSHVPSSLDRIFDPKEVSDCYMNGIAVIDVGACGVTKLHWVDLIPHLKRVYQTIIGVDSRGRSFESLTQSSTASHTFQVKRHGRTSRHATIR